MTEQPQELMPYEASPDQLAQLGDRAIQRVDAGGYATAIRVQVERQLATVEHSVKEEAALLGESGFYSWAAGGKRVEGPSIKLANVLARLWGNCAVRPEPVQDAGDAWVFTATFIDLQTGFTLGRQFRQSKRSTVAGKYDAERKMDIRFQVGQSKAIRNVIVNALPQWLVEGAIDASQGGVRAKFIAYIKANGEDAARKMVTQRLGKVSVSEADILRKTGRDTITGLTIEDMIRLAGDCRALEDGAETAATLFPSETQPDDGKSGAQRIMARVKAANGETSQPVPEPPPLEPAERDPDTGGLAADPNEGT
jgi:hypothetical protein